MLEKNFEQKIWKKLKKICTQRMWSFERSWETNYFNFFFFFGCANQNKALGMMKLISNFFFHERIYRVNFKRIDSGLSSMTILTIAAREIFKKNRKIVVVFCGHPSVTRSLVEAAWNALYTLSLEYINKWRSKRANRKLLCGELYIQFPSPQCIWIICSP